ncbi:MAG: ISNCY family transposase, partial [Gammaproteobacteria bacterium]
GQQWDLIVTMDDATSEHYTMFFVPEEGTASSFQGVRAIIESRALFSSLGHYWNHLRSGRQGG